MPVSERPGANNNAYATDDGLIRIAYHDNHQYSAYVIAHEAAHLLWNKGEGANSSANAFLNESFAEYFSWLFAREYFGQQRYAEIIAKNREFTRDAGKISSVSPARTWQENQRLLYNKGAYLLSTVHAEFGDERFYAWLRMILRNKPATTSELVQLLKADAAASPAVVNLVAELSP